MGNKFWGKVVIGLFVTALLVFAFGLMMSKNQREAITDQQSPVGQIRSAPTSSESAPAAQPPQPDTSSATSAPPPSTNQ
jgi:hypothetical protein